MVPNDALIVAGGRGTRLQPLTYGTPKPLLDFCGEPFLIGVLRRLADAGVSRVLLVVGAETAPFAALRPAAADLGIALEAVPEPAPLDTAGGVRSVLDRLDRAFLVLNGDILTDIDIAGLAAAHRVAGADATLALTRVEDTSSFGVAVRDGTRITRFVEKPAPGTLPGQDAINAGTYLVEPHVLAAHEVGRLSFEREVFPGLIDRGGHLEGFVWDGVWADLGTPERYREGHRLALGGELDWPSVRRVPARDHAVRVEDGAQVAPDAELRGPVLVLTGARIAAGAIVGPDTVVGREAHVGARAVLTDTVLHDEVEVGEGVEARGLVAGRGAVLHAGCTVGDAVVLGPGETVSAGEMLREGERRPAAEG